MPERGYTNNVPTASNHVANAAARTAASLASTPFLDARTHEQEAM